MNKAYFVSVFTALTNKKSKESSALHYNNYGDNFYQLIYWDQI